MNLNENNFIFINPNKQLDLEMIREIFARNGYDCEMQWDELFIYTAANSNNTEFIKEYVSPFKFLFRHYKCTIINIDENRFQVLFSNKNFVYMILFFEVIFTAFIFFDLSIEKSYLSIIFYVFGNAILFYQTRKRYRDFKKNVHTLFKYYNYEIA